MKITLPLFLVCGAVLSTSANAAYLIPALNAPIIHDFSSRPGLTEVSTAGELDSAGSAGLVIAAGGLDSAINLNANVSASGLTTQLGSTDTYPGTQANLGRWNSGLNTGTANGGFLQFRPTGAAYVVSMVTVTNVSGLDIRNFQISYDYLASTASTADEEIDGLRAYYSLSGTAGSWITLTALSSDSVVTTGTIASPEKLSMTLDLSATPWATGKNFYLLWADDNGTPVGSASNPENERSYGIDNLVFVGSAVPEPSACSALFLSLGGMLLRRNRKQLGR
jgi:hypothetical protein